MRKENKLQAAYETVFNKVTEAMKQGEIPWRKTWTTSAPCNAITGRAYSGINFFLLSLSGQADPRWLTYKQATQKGGTIKKGEKGMPIVFWTMFKTTDETNGKDKNIPVLKYFTVFNVSQTEGIQWEQAEEVQTIQTAEDFLQGFKDCPVINHGPKPCYRPSTDEVFIPAIHEFTSIEEYYATLFHEAVGHGTGHQSRLNRKGVANFDHFASEQYSTEELHAEFTSAFACAHCGIDNTVENSAAYIKGWLKFLQDNPKALVHAASSAQKAIDYALGIKNSSVE